MTKIDELLKDIWSDDSYKSFSQFTKENLAVLLFLWNKQIFKDKELIDDLHEWLENLNLKTVDIDEVLKNCREKGILNRENMFRKGKDTESGILWILFATTLEGNLDCQFDSKKGDYTFKITDEGIKKVEKMGMK